MNYWKLIMWDGETINVKPENAPLIQKKLASAEGFITTPDRSIAVKGVKDFHESTERYTDQKLIEGAAQAFNEPVIENDCVLVRWVKKPVTKREYSKHYANIPAYRKIGEQNNYVMIMWRQPVHLIDSRVMEELSPDDEINLSRMSY